MGCYRLLHRTAANTNVTFFENVWELPYLSSKKQFEGQNS